MPSETTVNTMPSEPTLYQVNIGGENPDSRWATIRWLIGKGDLAPVEPETTYRWCFTHKQQRIQCEQVRLLAQCADVGEVAVVRIEGDNDAE